MDSVTTLILVYFVLYIINVVKNILMSRFKNDIYLYPKKKEK